MGKNNFEPMSEQLSRIVSDRPRQLEFRRGI